ncbi:MAG: hypothetical protein D6702_03300 [Planctomycetota bacterium]|nr:MAG: hypothetical protein D6702_03300 [Planctomycetota bacterium]
MNRVLPVLLLLALAAALPAQSGPQKEVRAGDRLTWLAAWSLREAGAGEEAEPIRFARFLDPPLASVEAPNETAAESAERPAPKGPRFLLLCFWSPSCPWQNAWDPELDAIAREYRPLGVATLAIASNAEDNADPKRILERKQKAGLGFPILLDPHNELADRFGARTTPHIFLLDRSGRVLYTGAIDDDAHRKKPVEKRRTWLRDALAAAIAGRPIPVTSSPPQGCGIHREKKKPADRPLRR